MSAEFGTIDEACYFCGQPKTVKFSEHYYFCPSCIAIYTINIIQEDTCLHIVYGVPLLIREPWYTGIIETKTYIQEFTVAGEERQRCSICLKRCVADGW